MITEDEHPQLIEFLGESLEIIEKREEDADDNTYDAPKRMMVLTGRRLILENSMVFLTTALDPCDWNTYISRLKLQSEAMKTDLHLYRERRKELKLPISLRHAKRLGQYEQTQSIIRKVEEICSEIDN